jgi:phage-related tail fiber protein
MSAVNIVITDAGRAEIINAENTGTAPVLISEIGVGTGQYTPTASQTALQNETKRLTTFGGDSVGDDIIHLTIRDEGPDAYLVYEFGLYTQSGTLFAVYSQTGSPIINKTSTSILLLAVDIALKTVNPESVTFGVTDFLNPPATTERQGVVQLATNAETITGTDPNKAVTVAGLHNKTATTSRRGVVQLNNTVTSTSTSEAATANAVKSANDNANTRALASRTITAGDGLSGGGTLEENRMLSLGTPGTITGSSTNNVTATSHTHAVNKASTAQEGVVQLNNTVTSTSTSQAATANAVKTANDNANTRALASRTITAGDGLSGGGDLSANRTLNVDGTVVRTSGNQTITGTKTFNGVIDGTAVTQSNTDTTTDRLLRTRAFGIGVPNTAGGAGSVEATAANGNALIRGFYRLPTSDPDNPLGGTSAGSISFSAGINSSAMRILANWALDRVYYQSYNDGAWKDPVEFYHTGNETILRENIGVPVGGVIYLATTVAPPGYLKANGAAVSRSTYADLFNRVGTF